MTRWHSLRHPMIRALTSRNGRGEGVRRRSTDLALAIARIRGIRPGAARNGPQVSHPAPADPPTDPMQRPDLH
ncbi:hypothetical protein SAMN05216207_104644 [Pseudonocardia ammonioxydans]|uniref:Uncharacterized protein n=1 Tax=Pseudonocardia ammonioxydans TaxID=260086 RepID=A0A1I5GGS9_PSUAM|nr:hypothetical protein [Pseudonocardia ammonioxydans]SFO35093.1 hypothetical protein SAMN05216207_104644 [Pseudonocardia ammonioxydans]